MSLLSKADPVTYSSSKQHRPASPRHLTVLPSSNPRPSDEIAYAAVALLPLLVLLMLYSPTGLILYRHHRPLPFVVPARPQKLSERNFENFAPPAELLLAGRLFIRRKSPGLNESPSFCNCAVTRNNRGRARRTCAPVSRRGVSRAGRPMRFLYLHMWFSRARFNCRRSSPEFRAAMHEWTLLVAARFHFGSATRMARYCRCAKSRRARTSKIIMIAAVKVLTLHVIGWCWNNLDCGVGVINFSNCFCSESGVYSHFIWVWIEWVPWRLIYCVVSLLLN